MVGLLILHALGFAGEIFLFAGEFLDGDAEFFELFLDHAGVLFAAENEEAMDAGFGGGAAGKIIGGGAADADDGAGGDAEEAGENSKTPASLRSVCAPVLTLLVRVTSSPPAFCGWVKS